MRAWLRRNHAIAWVILAIAVLSIANLLNLGLISPDWMEKNVNLIDSASSILTTLFIIFAGLVSYFRFFHGRLFKPKLRINIDHGIIEIEGSNLHWVDVQLENAGSTTLWNYEVKITVNFDQTDKDIELHSLASARDKNSNLIDPGEIAYEHGAIKAPKEIEFLTFHIEVCNSAGTIWDRCATVSNKT